MPIGFCDDGFDPDSGDAETGTAECAPPTCAMCGNSERDKMRFIHLPSLSILASQCLECGYAWHREA